MAGAGAELTIEGGVAPKINECIILLNRTLDVIEKRLKNKE